MAPLCGAYFRWAAADALRRPAETPAPTSERIQISDLVRSFMLAVGLVAAPPRRRDKPGDSPKVYTRSYPTELQPRRSLANACPALRSRQRLEHRADCEAVHAEPIRPAAPTG